MAAPRSAHALRAPSLVLKVAPPMTVLSVGQHNQADSALRQGLSEPGPNDRWPDLKIRVAPARPRIEAGVYVARTVGLEAFSAYKRKCVALFFDVYASAFEAGVILARVPMYFRLPPEGRRLSPSAKLVRLFDLLGPRPQRLDRLPLNSLRDKLWKVEVGDVSVGGGVHDSRGRPRPLHEAQRYSVIRCVLERLA